MAGQPVPQSRRAWSSAGRSNSKVDCEEGRRVRSSAVLLLDLGVVAVAGEEGQGDFLRVAGAEDERDDALVEMSLPLLGQGVQVGQRELARLDLLLDLGGVLVAEERLEGVAGDERRAGCCGWAAAGRAA